MKRASQASGASGGANSAPSAQISGRLARSDDTTGQPSVMASSGGRPNPSVKEGNARQRQSCRSAAISPSVSRPSQAMLPLIGPALPEANTFPSREPTIANFRPRPASWSANPMSMPTFLCGAGEPITTIVPSPAAARVTGECCGLHRNACSRPLGITAILLRGAIAKRSICPAEKCETVVTLDARRPMAGNSHR